jgi:multiple sugar transport system substrate-binding protein
MNKPIATRLSRRTFLGVSGACVGSGILAGCGGSSGSGGKVQVTWSTWGTPSDLRPMQNLADQFSKSHAGISTKMLPLPQANYSQKIQSELVSNTAPDMFYAGDTLMAQLIQNGSVVELGPLLHGSDSAEKQGDFASALLPPAEDTNGKLFGVPTDCNAMTMWYNTSVLQKAGVDSQPAATFAAGNWTLDAFQNVVDKVRKSGKRVLVFSNWNGETYPWITSRGGQIFDNGRFVGNEDAKTVAAVSWLREMIQSKAFYYASALPKGQTADAMLMADQLAFTVAGRWTVPQYQKALGAKADIVPHPTPDGKLPQTMVIGSWAAINKKSRHLTKAFAFLSDYVSAKGQDYREKGGGISVPSIKGADQVVLSGHYPAHAKTFIDLRDNGYSSTVEETRHPAISNDIFAPLDKYFTNGGDAKKVLDGIAKAVNPVLGKG